MPVLATNDPFKTAFQLLASTVRDFYASSRPCVGATLKPALYRRGNFNEQSLGFRKFGDFLRAAEAAGYVHLAPTPGGDIGVRPATGSQEPAIQQQTAALPTFAADSTRATIPAAARVRVRPDLWGAFNSFSAPWVYDRSNDTARMCSESLWCSTQGGLPDAELIPIPPGRERVLGWMRSFASMQDAETGPVLFTALEGNAPIYQFNNLVRSRGLQWSWGRYHVQQVLAAIEAWATSNNVHPKDVTIPFYSARYAPQPPPTQPAPPTGEFSRATPQASLLAARLESLVDNLINELITLRGLLQVAGPKRDLT
jgi:hypothetical protein